MFLTFFVYPLESPRMYWRFLVYLRPVGFFRFLNFSDCFSDLGKRISITYEKSDIHPGRATLCAQKGGESIESPRRCGVCVSESMPLLAAMARRTECGSDRGARVRAWRQTDKARMQARASLLCPRKLHPGVLAPPAPRDTPPRDTLPSVGAREEVAVVEAAVVADGRQRARQFLWVSDVADVDVDNP